MPEQKDNDFTWKDFQARNNNELVAILGNFVNRALVLSGKHFGGHLPDYIGQATDMDMALAKVVSEAPAKIGEKLDAFRFREALQEFMELARAGNRYMAESEPWKTVKTDMNRTAQVLHMSLQLCASLAVLAEPFLPHTSQKLRALLALNGDFNWFEGGRIDLLRKDHGFGTPGLLFDKIEDEAILKQMEKLKAMSNQAQTTNPTVMANPEPETPAAAETSLINIDDFAKVELKVGKVLSAEPVPKADKLLKLSIDLGEPGGPRTILSGIALHFQPEEVVGRQVVVVANLAPRKMRGIDSQGMILMADDAEGKLVFVAPDEAVQAGTGVR